MTRTLPLLKVFHTSDWHLGRLLYGKKRHKEFESFLNWLLAALEERKIELLLIAGDIFDTSNPSPRAQELYYRFLYRVGKTPCQHVVIIAGNHDSPSFLAAPSRLLQSLNIYVIAQVSENIEDEILIIRNSEGFPRAIICAVPYLRDRDIRVIQPGESVVDKEKKLIEGIREHYADIAALAQKKKASLSEEVPIIAMGHLFVSGGQILEGDGVRDLYVGSLAHISSSIFPESLDYVALGHLHIPQKVPGSVPIRYSGSPLPMGFGEAKQQKSLCELTFQLQHPVSIELIPIPNFQKLVRIQGGWKIIESQLRVLIQKKLNAWIEIIMEGENLLSNPREHLLELISGTELEILRIKAKPTAAHLPCPNPAAETLQNLNVVDVFEHCLEIHQISPDIRSQLRKAYQEIVLGTYDLPNLVEK